MQTYTSKPIYRYTMFGVFSRQKRALHQWSTCILIVPCIYIYNVGITCFTAPTQVFSRILHVHVSEMLCTFQRCCARVRDAVHVSQQLCTFHRSCARFTSPLITFVFNCIHTECILISKSIGATKHVLPISLSLSHQNCLSSKTPTYIIKVISINKAIKDKLHIYAYVQY